MFEYIINALGRRWPAVALGGATTKAGSEAGLVVSEISNTDDVNGSWAMAQDNDRFTIATSTTPVDTPDISWADEVNVCITRTGSTDTIEITPSYDGVNFESTPVEGRDASAALVACTALVDEIVSIPLNAKKLRFTASGNTDTFTIAWSARHANRSAV